MIELTPAAALILYLCAALSVPLILWIVQHYQSRKKIILSPEKTLHVCEFCHFAYLAEEEKKISRCPCCKSLNQHQSK